MSITLNKEFFDSLCTCECGRRRFAVGHTKYKNVVEYKICCTYKDCAVSSGNFLTIEKAKEEWNRQMVNYGYTKFSKKRNISEDS